MPGLGGNAWEASFSRVLTVSTEHSLPLITASLRWDPDVHTVNRPLHGKDKRRINRYVYLSVEKNCMQTERDVLRSGIRATSEASHRRRTAMNAVPEWTRHRYSRPLTADQPNGFPGCSGHNHVRV